jgi:hypothetical protein
MINIAKAPKLGLKFPGRGKGVLNVAMGYPLDRIIPENLLS